MKKLYKYRPLTEFLFKELYYQELYFASYNELNDPLDLSARIEFTSDNQKSISYLLWFIFKTQFDIDELHKSNENISKLVNFNKDKRLQDLLANEIFNNEKLVLKTKSQIWTSDIIEIITKSIKCADIDIVFDSDKFKSELERLANKFFRNSYVTCLSETNDNFLMWSHYASKHAGICLEFSLENGGLFPYEMNHRRILDKEKYKEMKSEWESKSSVFWDRIRKVIYQDEQPFINFYNFSAVFENEYDCDLIGLSKPWTYLYASELERLFSCKTKGWAYENEWRAISVNFDSPKEPEERIRHYPIECLSSVYFGVNTPETIRNRVYKILHRKNPDIVFFESRLNGSDSLEFSNWEFNEE